MGNIDTAQWITFLTLVVGFGLQIYRENRQRRWDQEDRAEVARTVLHTAQHLEHQVIGTAAKLATHVEEQSSRLGEKIDENTKISTDAFHEANTVNLKLQSIGIEHNTLQRAAQDQAQVERSEKASP